MGVHHIPPRDPNEGKINRTREILAEVFGKYITGRGRETKINNALDEAMAALAPMLRLRKAPSKGATVMTEAATRNRETKQFHKGPSNL